MKFLITILALTVLAASCSNTRESSSESVSPNVSDSANQASKSGNSGTTGTNSGSSDPEESASGDNTVNPIRDGWQVIVPPAEEREYVRERVFEWPGGGGQQVDVLSTEYAVDKQYELESRDQGAREPHFDGPFRVEILAELTVDGTLFGYMLWLRGVGVGHDSDPEKQRARDRYLTVRIFDREGKGKFERVSDGSTRVPNWVTSKR
ncbi:MAG: hypothetical protein IPM63_05145 [Acidobacteriota bacterium]|nr:MAG: hypothetical protein IPM63_05145 [Acidobacteriota bacterium]